jgi:hypothetical protein
MPMTPPRPAHAFKTSSGASRLMFQSALAPVCVRKMGFRLAAMVSSVVCGLEWAQSIAIPTSFILSTARRPKLVSPPSFGSLRPVPREFDSL